MHTFKIDSYFTKQIDTTNKLSVQLRSLLKNRITPDLGKIAKYEVFGGQIFINIEEPTGSENQSGKVLEWLKGIFKDTKDVQVAELDPVLAIFEKSKLMPEKPVETAKKPEVKA